MPCTKSSLDILHEEKNQMLILFFLVREEGSSSRHPSCRITSKSTSLCLKLQSDPVVQQLTVWWKSSRMKQAPFSSIIPLAACCTHVPAFIGASCRKDLHTSSDTSAAKKRWGKCHDLLSLFQNAVIIHSQSEVLFPNSQCSQSWCVFVEQISRPLFFPRGYRMCFLV